MTSAGRRIGDYTLIQHLGEGGMGSVWLGEHAMLGRRAAIKILHDSFASRADIVTRFFNEARAASAISDLGIVQIFDFGRDADGTVFIVMELLDGEPLDHRLRRHGVLPVDAALRLMRQVASSLGAAHGRGIVHRDLKPENIFIVRDPEVVGGERTKLLDFGIAKLSDQAGVKTQTSTLMGTPTFMSPEQCRGAGHVDQRSDIYSLGCVLFVLVTGRPPFDAEGPGDIIAMHLREPAPLASSRNPALPREIDELIARCLAKDPAQRFASGLALASALEALLAGGVGRASTTSTVPPAPPVQATPTTLSSAASEVSAPRRSRMLGLSAFVALVVSAGVVFAVARNSEPAPAPVPASAPAVPDAAVPDAAVPVAVPPDAALPDAAVPAAALPVAEPPRPEPPPKRRASSKPKPKAPAAAPPPPPPPAPKKKRCDRDGDGVPDDWSCS